VHHYQELIAMTSRRKTLAAVGAALVVLVSIAWPLTLGAQTTGKATVGQEASLVTNAQNLTVTVQPQKGAARVDKTADRFALLYKPKDDIKDKTTDSLEYQVAGQAPQKITIDIEPRAAAADAGQKPAPDPGAAAGFPPGTYEQSLRAIFVLFALAVILESSLAVIFNWRPFVETFNARAVRPVISFLVAYLFVVLFELDLMTKLVNVIKPGSYPPNTSGQLLTALMLAGGSAAVNNVLVGLGFRQKRTPESAVPKPPPTQGWIAVKVDRKRAVGPVSVFIGPPPAAGAKPPLVAVLHKPSRRGFRYFLADPGRFPNTGGYPIAANTVVVVHVDGIDSAKAPVHEEWGPTAIAGGAVIDLEFTM
jgi:hypothetical protein